MMLQLKGGGAKTPDTDWSRGRGAGRSSANSRANSPPREQTTTILPPTQRSRRGSRVARQHSYDEEVKNSITPNNTESGLGLPAPMPRRASAYDVYAVQGKTFRKKSRIMMVQQFNLQAYRRGENNKNFN